VLTLCKLFGTEAYDAGRIVGRTEITIGPSGLRQRFAILSRVNHPPILLGTSSFTAAGWNGSFYPRGMKPSDYLAFYAERFHTVEVDRGQSSPALKVRRTARQQGSSVVKEHGGEGG
jgi:hypothetical protein